RRRACAGDRDLDGCAVRARCPAPEGAVRRAGARHLADDDAGAAVRPRLWLRGPGGLDRRSHPRGTLRTRRAGGRNARSRGAHRSALAHDLEGGRVPHSRGPADRLGAEPLVAVPRLIAPSDALLDRVLADARAAKPSYPEVGATRAGELPAGYRIDRYERRLD